MEIEVKSSGKISDRLPSSQLLEGKLIGVMIGKMKTFKVEI